MALEITAQDQSNVSRVISYMYQAYPLLMRDGSVAQQIAAVRYAIANWRNMPGTRTNGKAVSVNDYQLLLCKFVALYPRESAMYVVCNKFPSAMMQSDTTRTLVASYRQQLRRSGTGIWANSRLEHVVLSLYGMNDASEMGSTYLVIIPRADIRTLFTVYAQQRDAARNAGEVAEDQSLDARKQAAQQALSGATLTDRKRLSRDISGTCYQCAAPKQRGTVCMVCGYVPSTLRKSS